MPCQLESGGKEAIHLRRTEVTSWFHTFAAILIISLLYGRTFCTVNFRSHLWFSHANNPLRTLQLQGGSRIFNINPTVVNIGFSNDLSISIQWQPQRAFSDY